MAYNKQILHEQIAHKQIAYLYVPDFGVTIAQQANPALDDTLLRQQPLVLFDDAGQVLATDARAAEAGVTPGQTERQVVARCPLALLQPAARYPIFEAQAAFSERVARYAGRWQPAGLGAAYLDATGLPGDLLRWCQELTEEVRGLGLTASIGITIGKFGASAAGQAASPAHMLILTPSVQPTFLSAQTAALLPLETDALLQLRHLGIRTLGQYARLPGAAVLARWGQAGRTAQRWAQGYDDRPVIPPSERREVSARIEFDGVLMDRDILLAALARKAEALLSPLRDRLQAAGWLELAITRGDRRVVAVKHTFPLPSAASNTVKLALGGVLERVAWDGEGAADVALTFGNISDAPAQQLSLLDTPSPRETLTATLEKLAARYGPDTFYMAVLTEPDHPLPERRVSWQRFD